MNALTALIQYLFQRLAFAVFAVAAVAITVCTVMAALGQWAWIELPLNYAGQPVENAGMYAQIGLTILAVGICFFIPTNRRIMQLETSHRKFALNMDDITRAYGAVHAADRGCLLYTSPSPRDLSTSRMPSSA